MARSRLVSRLGDRTGTPTVADLVALHPQLGIDMHPARPGRPPRRTHLTPTLRYVRIGRTTDVLAVRIVTGQSTADWHKQSDALAAAWRADRITIRATAPGELKITLMRGDVLAEPIGLPIPTAVTPVDLGPCRWGSPKPATAGSYRCSAIMC